MTTPIGDQYKRKVVIVWAKQWFQHGDHPEVTTLEHWNKNSYLQIHDEQPCGVLYGLDGPYVIRPSDWIVYENGGYWPYKNKDFVEKYEKIPKILSDESTTGEQK